MMRFLSVFFAVFMSIWFLGCSGASIMDSQVHNKQARIIFDVPKSVDEEVLKNALKDAIALRVDSIEENEGLMPEDLPEKPEKPSINQQFKKIMSFTGKSLNASMQYRAKDLSNAWYNVGGSGGMTSEYLNKAEYYKAGIYPYKNGYKVYIYEFYTEGTDGILGNLTNAAVNAIIGNDGALVYMAQVRDKFLSKVPQAKILSQSPSKLKKINLNAIGWDKK